MMFVLIGCADPDKEKTTTGAVPSSGKTSVTTTCTWASNSGGEGSPMKFIYQPDCDKLQQAVLVQCPSGSQVTKNDCPNLYR